MRQVKLVSFTHAADWAEGIVWEAVCYTGLIQKFGESLVCLLLGAS